MIGLLFLYYFIDKGIYLLNHYIVKKRQRIDYDDFLIVKKGHSP
jgi:hypothetical protein